VIQDDASRRIDSRLRNVNTHTSIIGTSRQILTSYRRRSSSWMRAPVFSSRYFTITGV
jgi:hypothetical protein